MQNINTISREEAAILQLEDAINLFYQKRYISAITLSAAAEEILGKLSDEHYSKLLQKKTKSNFSDDTATFLSITASMIIRDGKELSEMQKEENAKTIRKEFILMRNKTRNSLKHYNPGDKGIPEKDLINTALDHITGAIINYKYRIGQLPKNSIIERFCKIEGLG